MLDVRAENEIISATAKFEQRRWQVTDNKSGMKAGSFKKSDNSKISYEIFPGKLITYLLKSKCMEPA